MDPLAFQAQKLVSQDQNERVKEYRQNLDARRLKMHQSTLARKRDEELNTIKKQDEEELKPKYLMSASKKKRLDLNGMPLEDTSVSGVIMKSAQKKRTPSRTAGKTVKIESDDADNELSKDQGSEQEDEQEE